MGRVLQNQEKQAERRRLLWAGQSFWLRRNKPESVAPTQVEKEHPPDELTPVTHHDPAMTELVLPISTQ